MSKGYEAWQRAQDNAELDHEELPETEHAWFRPFHQATSSGVVDGGSASPARVSTTGDVSE